MYASVKSEGKIKEREERERTWKELECVWCSWEDAQKIQFFIKHRRTFYVITRTYIVMRK